MTLVLVPFVLVKVLFLSATNRGHFRSGRSANAGPFAGGGGGGNSRGRTEPTKGCAVLALALLAVPVAAGYGLLKAVL